MADETGPDGRKRRLNIGAGQTYLPGFTNIDISPKAEICLDLNCQRLPFADESVELVFSYHTLEHLTNYLFALGEIHRVLRHGGRFLVGVPYVTSTLYNLVNPYHRQHFNEFSFDFFDPQKLLGSAEDAGSVMFQKVFHRFHYMPEFAAKPEAEKDHARRHFFNVVRKIDFGLVAMKRGLDQRIAVGRDMQEDFVTAFDALLRARLPYPDGGGQSRG
jgi:predicted SAM-dependent methyltransferase